MDLYKLVPGIKAIPAKEYALRFAYDLAAGVLRSGPVPKHIAFVMDGNRRYSKKYSMEAGEGHYAGFETFIRTASACAQLGVKDVTVYAFSIENFHRKEQEKELLFSMMRTKMFDMVKDEDSVARKNGWRIRFLGDRSMLDADIVERIERTEEITKDFTKMNVNIACPYTSRDDIAQAIRKASAHDAEEALLPADFEQLLYTGDSNPLDLLIRTSGETRLSDFMCWESSPSVQVAFVPTLWPEFSIWDLYTTVFKWAYRETKEGKQSIRRLDQLPSPPPVVSVSDARNRN